MRDQPIGDRPRTGTRSNHRATSSSTAVAPTLPTTAPMMEPVIRTSTTMSASLVIHRASAHRRHLAKASAPREHVAVRAREVEEQQVDGEDAQIGRELRRAEETGDHARAEQHGEERHAPDDEPPAQHARRDGAPVVRFADELHRRAREQRGGREREPRDERRGDGEEPVARGPQRAREHGRRDQPRRQQHELRGEAEDDAVGEPE